MPEPEMESLFFGPMVIAQDFEESYRFYKGSLGLAGGGETPYAEFRTGSGPLVVLDAKFWRAVTSLPAAARGTGGRGGIVLAIKVRSVDESYRRLVEEGRSFLGPPTNRPQMGLRTVFLRDPDGNLIELSSGLSVPRERPAPRKRARRPGSPPPRRSGKRSTGRSAGR
ncbi:MAG: VOC family protein [Thermoplasmata archaeon]|nr:VOC family protein [Thermoplasmata archaeon]